jgi:hypothetical protein
VLRGLLGMGWSPYIARSPAALARKEGVWWGVAPQRRGLVLPSLRSKWPRPCSGGTTVRALAYVGAGRVRVWLSVRDEMGSFMISRMCVWFHWMDEVILFFFGGTMM